jgi:hypothetical protein
MREAGPGLLQFARVCYYGVCRRQPPQLAHGCDNESWGNGVWPTTDGDDWCGEFRPLEDENHAH